MTAQEVLEELREARRIHAEWAAYLRDDREGAAEPVPREEAVGAPEWHDHWVEVYDEALRLLGPEA